MVIVLFIISCRTLWNVGSIDSQRCPHLKGKPFSSTTTFWNVALWKQHGYSQTYTCFVRMRNTTHTAYTSQFGRSNAVVQTECLSFFRGEQNFNLRPQRQRTDGQMISTCSRYWFWNSSFWASMAQTNEITKYCRRLGRKENTCRWKHTARMHSSRSPQGSSLALEGLTTYSHLLHNYDEKDNGRFFFFEYFQGKDRWPSEENAVVARVFLFP